LHNKQLRPNFCPYVVHIAKAKNAISSVLNLAFSANQSIAALHYYTIKIF